jgi:hypothetical protein
VVNHRLVGPARGVAGTACRRLARGLTGHLGRGLLSRDGIPNQTPVVPHALAIGETALFDVLPCPLYQALRGKSLIGQYESRGSR